MMIIKTAKFVKSSPSVGICPDSTLPEFAFIGRSNVGKSSLINMLTIHSNLALVSSKPGKTRLINHYLINDSWHLVDLPGYGYAKASKAQRAAFLPMITDYISKREQLSLLFVLIDSRIEPQQIDLDFINKLGELEVPFAIIFTKIDKLSKTVLQKNMEQYKNTLLEYWDQLPEIFLESIITQSGREDILKYIDSINLINKD